MEKHQCPQCGENTNSFGKCTGEFLCLKCNHTFSPYVDVVPCKLCGSNMIVTSIQKYHGREYRRAFCECGVAGPYMIDEEKANTAWNKLNT